MKKIFITLLIVISLSFLLSEQETVLGTSVELIVILGFIILSATFRSFATNLFGYNRLIKVPMKNQNGKKILLVGEVHLYNGAETREVKKLIKPYRKIFHEVGKIGIPKSDPNFKKPLVYKVFKIILRFYYFFLKSIFIPTESPGEIAKKNNQPVIGLETEQTRIQDIGLDGLRALCIAIGLLFVYPLFASSDFILFHHKLPSMLSGYIQLSLFMLVLLQISGVYTYFYGEDPKDRKTFAFLLDNRDVTIALSINTLVDQNDFQEGQPIFMGKMHIPGVVANLKNMKFVKLK